MKKAIEQVKSLSFFALLILLVSLVSSTPLEDSYQVDLQVEDLNSENFTVNGLNLQKPSITPGNSTLVLEYTAGDLQDFNFELNTTEIFNQNTAATCTQHTNQTVDLSEVEGSKIMVKANCFGSMQNYNADQENDNISLEFEIEPFDNSSRDENITLMVDGSEADLPDWDQRSSDPEVNVAGISDDSQNLDVEGQNDGFNITVHTGYFFEALNQNRKKTEDDGDNASMSVLTYNGTVEKGENITVNLSISNIGESALSSNINLKDTEGWDSSISPESMGPGSSEQVQLQYNSTGSAKITTLKAGLGNAEVRLPVKVGDVQRSLVEGVDFNSYTVKANYQVQDDQNDQDEDDDSSGSGGSGGSGGGGSFTGGLNTGSEGPKVEQGNNSITVENIDKGDSVSLQKNDLSMNSLDFRNVTGENETVEITSGNDLNENSSLISSFEVQKSFDSTFYAEIKVDRESLKDRGIDEESLGFYRKNGEEWENEEASLKSENQTTLVYNVSLDTAEYGIGSIRKASNCVSTSEVEAVYQGECKTYENSCRLPQEAVRTECSAWNELESRIEDARDEIENERAVRKLEQAAERLNQGETEKAESLLNEAYAVDSESQELFKLVLIIPAIILALIMIALVSYKLNEVYRSRKRTDILKKQWKLIDRLKKLDRRGEDISEYVSELEDAMDKFSKGNYRESRQETNEVENEIDRLEE